ncbi:MAG: Gfo/Idh/MocA family oxidoreductase [Puniceicoccales bacterium]|jgi:predicted dehydrogenase|nr:Gfo/Idh/MocA family oxidoreductase [Puniceicoccales bacterium]
MSEQINRRKFIRLGGAATAALTLFPSIVPSSVFGKNAPSKRVNFALIGCGNMGRSDLENVVRGLSSEGAYALAVCDVDRHRSADAVHDVNTGYHTNACLQFHDFREVTRHPDIDAVIIATPDHWHALTAIDAVRHGKDVYVEKPLTLTIEEGRLLVAEAQKHGRIGQTGTQQRSGRYFQRACELVRNGRIGKIKHVEIKIPANNRYCGGTWHEEPVPEGFDYDFWLGPAPYAPFTRQRTHYQFRFILDYASGQTTNFGAHNVDIAQWALGMDETGPVRYEGYGEFPSTGLFTTPTAINITAHYADGTVMTMRNREGDSELSIRFHGQTGWIEVSRQRVSASTPALLKEQIGPGEIQLYKSRNHLGNFLECIRTRQAPVATLPIGHRSTTICNISTIAMQLRRPLQWDPAKEEFVNDPVANRMKSHAMRGPWSLA